MRPHNIAGVKRVEALHLKDERCREILGLQHRQAELTPQQQTLWQKNSFKTRSARAFFIVDGGQVDVSTQHAGSARQPQADRELGP